MERRRLLKAGLVFGATFVGERIDVAQALAAGPLKSVPKVYEGEMSYYGKDHSWRVRLTVVKKRVVGGGSPFSGGTEQSSLVLVGTVKGTKVTMDAYVIDDPAQRFEENTHLGKITARLKGKTLNGKIDLPAISPEKGRFNSSVVEQDPDAMSRVAGVYDGEVADGAPNFKARVTVGANGTYVLDTITRPDGTPIAGRRGGVFILGPRLYDNADEHLLYAFPLPPSRRETASELQAQDEPWYWSDHVCWVDCTDDIFCGKDERREAAKRMSENAAKANIEPTGRIGITLGHRTGETTYSVMQPAAPPP